LASMSPGSSTMISNPTSRIIFNLDAHSLLPLTRALLFQRTGFVQIFRLNAIAIARKLS